MASLKAHQEIQVKLRTSTCNCFFYCDYYGDPLVFLTKEKICMKCQKEKRLKTKSTNSCIIKIARKYTFMSCIFLFACHFHMRKQIRLYNLYSRLEFYKLGVQVLELQKHISLVSDTCASNGVWVTAQQQIENCIPELLLFFSVLCIKILQFGSASLSYNQWCRKNFTTPGVQVLKLFFIVLLLIV